VGRRPAIWTVTRPEVDRCDARLELARRYPRIYGPATPKAFARRAGIGPGNGAATYAALSGELTPARTPVGDGWILARDEADFRAAERPSAPARLLPSEESLPGLMKPKLLMRGEAEDSQAQPVRLG
jgi:hypothetical protein